ncbi:uncharacterized protein EHS24_002983 [Apiotrichum porosum]|uniref:EamA domain-containing protein n=1 Tax=Apiotrichum porosum TaxID=105984 RepID=A0A427XG89_9TREE|nr:uncharacterized protein EHS24_002983 [Apiotrichum porosum]RSH77910.1 hypothetical protein EHS24_002983 [Apiotrichum porosum]
MRDLPWPVHRPHRATFNTASSRSCLHATPHHPSKDIAHHQMEGDPLLPKMPSIRALSGAHRYIVGVGLLLTVVLLWTASNFITADLETGDDGWNKPFLITYLNTSSFAFYLLPGLYRYWKKGTFARDHPHDISSPEYEPLAMDDDEPPARSSFSLNRSVSPCSPRAPLPPVEDVQPDDPQGLPKLTVRETAEVAAWWSAVWFLANWSLNTALAWASVASVTILSSTTSFFTLTLGRICGVEDVTRGKVFSALASFIGVVLVTRSDMSIQPSEATIQPLNPIWGDLLSLLSAAFYSVYVILLKVRLGDESRADTQLMLGFAGLFNIVCLIPVFPLLHYMGWETFELPPTRQAWTICIVNMFITLSSDYLYVLAMLKTTPMLVTIGLSLTIPFALLGSLLIPSASTDSITFMSLTGAALVVASFLVLGWQGWTESNNEHQHQVARQGDSSVLHHRHHDDDA